MRLRSLPPWASCAAAALVTRAAVLLAGYLAVVTIGYGLPRPVRAHDNEFLNLPARWDSGWYLGIASGGYRWDPARPPYERLKFFPAYPLLLRAVALPLDPGRHEVAWLWIGATVSTLLFWLGLLYVFRLGAGLQDEQAGRRAVWITAAYPFAIFFGVPYSESLFLASTTGAIYSYRRREWIASAAWGAVAGLTRPNGFLLTAVLMLMKCVAPRTRTNEWLWRAAALAAPIAGAALFSAYLYVTTGDAASWMAGQPGGRTPVNPVLFLRDLAASCRHDGAAACVATRGYDLVNIAATMIPLILVVPIFRRFGAALAAFVILNTAMPLFGIGFNCMGRYTSVLFPMFLWLGARLQGSSFRWWVAVSFAGELLAAAAFFTWRQVY